MEKYIEAWLNKDVRLFLSLLDEDVVVHECTGDTYLNKQVAENWFNGWHAEGNKVLAWDIKNHFYDEEKEVATVTWRFTCLYQEKEYTFDGATVVKFRDDKIVELDEYQMETEKRFPYMEKRNDRIKYEMRE